VVEQALLICRGSNESYLRNLLHCTAGIAFLGTPHVGSDLASWAKILTHLANVLRKANNEIVAVLQPGSESLANLQQEFHTMMEPLKIMKNTMKLYCFYEEIAVAGVGEVSWNELALWKIFLDEEKQIVPKHSAILAAYPNRGIHANHMDMTKFSSPQDAGYIAVSGQLWRWVKEIKAVLKAAEDAVEEEARASRAPPLPSQRLLLDSQPSGGPSSAGIVSTGGNATFNDNFVVGNWNPGK
jgi:protein SERAC1